MLLRLVVVSWCLLLAGCKKDPPPAPAPKLSPSEVTIEGAYHAIACGPVTAVWSGNAEALADLPPPVPKSYGVESLAFRFADGSSKGFAPTGQLFFNDWRFEIFSPDCQYTVLLADHFGPYHVVKTAELRGYLEHKVKPISLEVPKGAEAMVHDQLRWIDDTHVVFAGACCGGAKAVKANVVDGKVEVTLDAPTAPKGLRPTGDHFEAVP